MITAVAITLVLFGLGEMFEFSDDSPPPKGFRQITAIWFLFAGWWLFFKV
jgi:hypothetical protein